MPNILKAIYDEVVKHRATLEKASSDNGKATKLHLRRCGLCRAFRSEVDANSKADVDDADEESAARPLAAAPLTPCLYKVLEAISAEKGAFRLGARHSRYVDEEEEEEDKDEAGENGIGLLRPIFGAKSGKKAGRRYDDDDDNDDEDDGEADDDVDQGSDPSYEDVLRLVTPSLKMWARNNFKGDLHLRLLGKSIFLDKDYATSSKLSKKVRRRLWLYACVHVVECA